MDSGLPAPAQPRLDLKAVFLVLFALIAVCAIAVAIGRHAEIIVIRKKTALPERELSDLRKKLEALRKERASVKERLGALRQRRDNLRDYVRLLRIHMKRTGFPVRVITQVPNKKNMVALTIDDGWERKWIEQALAVLKEKKAAATLFPVGKMIGSNGDLWKRALKEGHEIGNHTYDHSPLPGLTEAQILNQIDAQQKALDKALGKHYGEIFFRPPGMSGFLNHWGTPAIRGALAKREIIVVLWDNETQFRVYRTKGLDVTPQVVADAATAAVKPGSIILLHFVKPDVEALGLIIDKVRKKGYRLVTLSCLTGMEF
jgi:peptidoglycan/xylan/chitin deacetylase (PgdA/CDA1 family)